MMESRSRKTGSASERRMRRLEQARQGAAARVGQVQAATVRGGLPIAIQPCPSCEVGELRRRGDGVIVCAMCGANHGELAPAKFKQRLLADQIEGWQGR